MYYNILLVQQANQELDFDVAEGIIRIKLRTTKSGLYMDLYLNDELVFSGKRCCNLMPLIMKQNVVIGNLFFKDTIGNEDPKYSNFNDRFQLIYDTTYIVN